MSVIQIQGLMEETRKVSTYRATLCMHVMQGTLNTCLWLQITAVLELCLMSVESVKI